MELCSFFTQKTAYELRISDWSSDVCSSELLDGREEAEIEHAGDPRLDDLADAFGKIGRDIAIGGVAFGLHRAAFEHRNLLAGALHLRCLVIGQPARPQPERLHQRAVDDEIGIAPDRRGEMRVTAEREPKMAVIRSEEHTSEL